MKLIARGRSVEPHARWPRQSLTRRTAAIQGMAQPCRLIDQLDAARAGGAYPRRTNLDQLGGARAEEPFQLRPKLDQLRDSRAGEAYQWRTNLDQLGDSRAGEPYQGPPKADASHAAAARCIGKLHLGDCPEGR